MEFTMILMLLLIFLGVPLGLIHMKNGRKAISNDSYQSRQVLSAYEEYERNGRERDENKLKPLRLEAEKRNKNLDHLERIPIFKNFSLPQCQLHKRLLWLPRHEQGKYIQPQVYNDAEILDQMKRSDKIVNVSENTVALNAFMTEADGTKKSYVASGFFFGLDYDPSKLDKHQRSSSRWVLTAAHCLTEDDFPQGKDLRTIRDSTVVYRVNVNNYESKRLNGHGGKYKNDGRFHPGITVIKDDFFIHPGYLDRKHKDHNCDSKCDIALIRLPNEVKVCNMSITTANVSNSTLDPPPDSVAIYGYPGSKSYLLHCSCSEYYEVHSDKSRTLIKTPSKAKNQPVEEYNKLAQMRYTHLTEGGMSGGPVYINNRLMGVHVAGPKDATNQFTYNTCALITPKMLEWIKETINKN